MWVLVWGRYLKFEKIQSLLQICQKKVLEVFAERIFNVGSLRSLLSLASNRGISNEGTLEQLS